MHPSPGTRLVSFSLRSDFILFSTGFNRNLYYKSLEVYDAVVAVGGTTVQGWLRFDAQGRFTRDRQSSTGVSGAGYTVAASSQAASSSRRYEFRGNSLILTYGDGRVERLLAVRDPEGTAHKETTQVPETLRLGASTYFLEKP